MEILYAPVVSCLLADEMFPCDEETGEVDTPSDKAAEMVNDAISKSFPSPVLNISPIVWHFASLEDYQAPVTHPETGEKDLMKIATATVGLHCVVFLMGT